MLPWLDDLFSVFVVSFEHVSEATVIFYERRERERDELTLGCHQNVKPKMQDQASPREQVEQNAVRALSTF